MTEYAHVFFRHIIPNPNVSWLSFSCSIPFPLKLPVSSTFSSLSLLFSPPLSTTSPHPTHHLFPPPLLSFHLLPALLCWSSNHNRGPWQMEDRREKLLTSQPEPVLSAHQLLPASPPCLQSSSSNTLPPSHTPALIHLLWGHSILLGNGAYISPYLATLKRTRKHNRWMFSIIIQSYRSLSVEMSAAQTVFFLWLQPISECGKVSCIMWV